MTRQLTDGAESGDTSRGTVSSGAASISATKRTGSYAYNIGNAGTANAIFDLPLYSTVSGEWYLRFAYRATAAGIMVSFMNGGATAGSIRMASFGNSVASCTVYNGTTLCATSSFFTMLTAEFHVFEVHFKHAASPNGIIEVKFDGTLVLSFSGATDAQSQITLIRLHQSSNNNSDTFYDDIALNDTSGSVDNSWVGDGGVLAALVPTATGTYTGFLASGSASTWQSTDEIPANSTDFAYTSVSGTVTTFVMSDISGLPAGASISRIWLELYAKETAAVGDKIATFLRSGAANSTGTSQSLTIAFARYVSDEYVTDPRVTGAWTVTAVNNIEAGMVSE